MTKTEMHKSIGQWALDRPKRDAARKSRKLVVPFPLAHAEEYLKLAKQVQLDLKGALAPAVPLLHVLDNRLKSLATASRE